MNHAREDQDTFIGGARADNTKKRNLAPFVQISEGGRHDSLYPFI